MKKRIALLLSLIITVFFCCVDTKAESEIVVWSEDTNIISSISVNKTSTGASGTAAFTGYCRGTANMILQKRTSYGTWEDGTPDSKNFTNKMYYSMTVNKTISSSGTYRWKYQVTAYNNNGRFQAKAAYTDSFVVN